MQTDQQSTLQLKPVSGINIMPKRMNIPIQSNRMEITAVPKPQVLQEMNTAKAVPVPNTAVSKNRLPFIEANTKEVTISHLRNECVVPVFSKDNEITISHQAFIEAIWQAATKVFPRETIEEPSIRVSHVIKGRTPEAIHKSVKDLLDEDKTIYWERMMFCLEVPSIYEDMAGNRLNLTIGGVRAYNHMNLYSKKTTEKFKVFIGFKNMVCCNLCISTDGYKSELKVMDSSALFNSAIEMFQQYNMAKHLYEMGALKEVSMTEHQFAQFLGRCRMYGFLPKAEQKKLPQMMMTDTQLGLIARSYFQDENFSVSQGEKEISMWKVYNLLTGANKSSYIDLFLDRSLNATELAYGLTRALHEESEFSWFLK